MQYTNTESNMINDTYYCHAAIILQTTALKML